MTLTHVEEAIGIVRAAGVANMPVVIGFTVETDGRLPDGRTLGEAIESVEADDSPSPAYYMINCAHPTHFEKVLDPGAAWVGRIRELRANASAMSHAELDNSTEIDEGNPAELAEQHRALCKVLPNLNIVGGCCGTDHRHVDAIFQACARG